MRSGWIAISLVLLGASTSGCGTSSTFACGSDEQCQSGAVAGTCQPNGYCSFPDDACPTGQRFGDAAPVEVANLCVEPEPATGSTTASTLTTGSTTSDPTQGLEASTLDPTDAAATLALDDTSTGPSLTTGPGTTGPGTTDSPGTDESTTAPAEDCRMVIDEFDGMALDPMWTEVIPVGGAIEQLGGQLSLTVPPDMDWAMTMVTTELGPMAGGWARVWINLLNDPDLPMTAGVFFINGDCELQIYVSEQAVRALVWSYADQAGMLLANENLPGIPIALQLRLEADGTAYFEHSQDGMTWDSIADGTFPECGDLTLPVTTAVIAAGQLSASAVRSFDRFEACVPP